MDSDVKPVTVLSAGRGDLVRTALPSLLEHDRRFAIVGETASDPTAAAQRLQPDLIVLDPAGGGRFDMALIGELRQAAPGSRLAVFSSRFELRSYTAAMHAAILGYFLPGFAALGRPFLNMLEGVGRWACGIADPAIAARFQAACGTTLQLHEPGEPAGSLSAREREVLHLFLQGMDHGEIAAALGIARGTVDTHVASLHRKLGARTPGQLGAIATRLGFS